MLSKHPISKYCTWKTCLVAQNACAMWMCIWVDWAVVCMYDAIMNDDLLPWELYSSTLLQLSWAERQVGPAFYDLWPLCSSCPPPPPTHLCTDCACVMYVWVTINSEYAMMPITPPPLSRLRRMISSVPPPPPFNWAHVYSQSKFGFWRDNIPFPRDNIRYVESVANRVNIWLHL